MKFFALLPLSLSLKPMNKLKTTLLGHGETTKRSLQFINKVLNTAAATSVPPPQDWNSGPPAVSLDELSELEKSAYHAWWKDLDPFSIGHLDRATLAKFLSGSGLPDPKLDQVTVYMRVRAPEFVARQLRCPTFQTKPNKDSKVV